MKQRSALEREVSELVIAANSGEASDKQLSRLDELIRTDPSAAVYAALLCDQLAALAWQGSMRGETQEQPACLRIAAGLVDDSEVHLVVPGAKTARPAHRWMWPTIAVGIGFVLGGLTVASIYRAKPAEIAATHSFAMASIHVPAEPLYEARLTRSTACLWEGSSVASHDIGRDFSSGESMHLLEGLAEFKLDWAHEGHATLSLEGPAAMMLTSEGMPTLRFGRLSATINTSQRPFVLETSIGRLSLADCGAIGVSAFGNEGEIHVFSGVATYDAAWRSPDQTSPLTIEAGQSLRIQTGDNGETQITWHKADAEYFAAQVSMAADTLAIPPAYVAAVKKAAPIGYWRFDRDSWPEVPNMMGPKLACHVDGSLARTNYQNNEAVEFGTTDEGGEITSTDVIDDSIHGSYSVEFWMKPSHYHLGAVVSLVGDPSTPGGLVPHAMLVELGGTGRIPTAVQHPGCIRFLHRSPAGRNASVGTSCYSETPYTLRKWQHVVATKDGAKMRLYTNGELVGEGEDASELPTGLRLLVGKLYPASGDRPFVGQFDELALYNRALKPEEISAHYRLVRPQTASKPSI